MYRFKKIFFNCCIHAFLVSVGLSCIFPLLWMLSSALKTQQTVFRDMRLIVDNPHWQNFSLAWTKGDFSIYFFNSLFYTFVVVSAIVLIASLAAYAFSRLEFKGKNFFFYLFLGAMMIPLPGGFVPLYVLLVKLGLANTRSGYIFSLINVGLPVSIYLLKTFFDKLPRDLEDSARIDGCGRLRIWWNIAFPLARPAIGVVVIFNTLMVWNEYIFALIILQSKSIMPLQKGLMVFQGAHVTEYPVLMAGITISIIPIILIYLLMQRFIMKGLTSEVLLG